MRSTLQIQIHEYFEDLNIIILLFYTINMNVVSLFIYLFIYFVFSEFEFLLYRTLSILMNKYWLFL